MLFSSPEPDAIARLQQAMAASHKGSWRRGLFGACAFCTTTFGLGHIVCIGLPFAPSLAPQLASHLAINPYDPVLMLKTSFALAALGLCASAKLWWVGAGPVRRALTIGLSSVALLASVAANTPHMHDMNQTLTEISGGDEAKKRWFLETDAVLGGGTLEQMCVQRNAGRPAETAWQKIRAAYRL